jgi:hypothetical protein
MILDLGLLSPFRLTTSYGKLFVSSFAQRNECCVKMGVDGIFENELKSLFSSFLCCISAPNAHSVPLVLLRLPQRSSCSPFSPEITFGSPASQGSLSFLYSMMSKLISS